MNHCSRLPSLLSLTLLLPACGDDSTAAELESSTSATAGTTGAGTSESEATSSSGSETDTTEEPALSLVDPVAGSEYPFASEVDVEWGS